VELAIALGLGGWILLIVGALVFGILAQLVGHARFGYEWLATAVAAGIGALVASEFVIGWQAFEPVWDGLALVPALVGGVVVGTVVAVATRFLTGGSYTSHAATA
jgi:uncharacterized membrane protein YeaQ/YmgE (transglycosylase-associated protein family)